MLPHGLDEGGGEAAEESGDPAVWGLEQGAEIGDRRYRGGRWGQDACEGDERADVAWRAWEISGIASNDESFHRIITFTYAMDWRRTARRRDSSDRDFARDCMVRVWVWVSEISGRRLRC